MTSAPCSRGLEKTGGAEDVADDHLCARDMDEVTDGHDVDQLLHRVAGRLEEHHSCWLRERLPPRDGSCRIQSRAARAANTFT